MPADHTAAPSAEIALLLQRLRVQQRPVSSPAEAAQAQTDLLLERIATLTSALRGADDGDASQAAARLLLADLAMIAIQLRGHAAAHHATLARALDDVREMLDRTDERATPL